MPEVIDRIYDKVGRDAKDRIIPITESITEQLHGTARIGWSTRKIEENWGAYGNLFRARGRKSMMGSLGVYFVAWRGIPSIILVMWPKGGEHGQKQLVEESRERWKDCLVMMRNKPEDWPGWEQALGVVFKKMALSEKTSLTELKVSIGRASRDFIRVVSTILQKLAVPIR